jgi:hypothetical protein
MEVMQEDIVAASAVCASGHRVYVFWNEKSTSWETAQERMARLARQHICEDCGAEFEDYGSTFWSKGPGRCNPCSDRAAAERSSRYRQEVRERRGAFEPRLNANSPWRTGKKWIAGT